MSRETLQKILFETEQIKAELDNFRPLTAEAEKRILQKFRLDWNYHSNKLGGNTYTYGETRMLLLHGVTAGLKPLNDYKQISGHDEAIEYLFEVVKGKEPITEIFIRHLHKLILVEPYWVDAVTPDGKPTRKLVQVGRYKTEPNHVKTITDEIFYFADPLDVNRLMLELLFWFSEVKASNELNPIVLATEFHYKFILIHPFDDGNGRMARLLMNFILMQYSYPPVIVKETDKENYIAVLRLSDAGVREPFTEYIAKNLQESLKLMISGAKGENISEEDDLSKELALLEQKIKGFGKEQTVERNEDISSK